MRNSSSLRRLAAIATCWTAFALFSASDTYRMAVDTAFTQNQSWPLNLWFHLTSALFWTVVTPLIIYAAERLPLLRPFRPRNAVFLLMLIPPLAVFRAALGGAVLCIAEGADSVAEVAAFIVVSVEVRFYRNVFLVAAVIGIVNLILANRAAAERERGALQTKKDLANNELQRLRAAMQPRFLSAALQAVKVQVATRPVDADKMLVELGGVLRKMLDYEKRGDVSLDEELAVVRHCLELERTRTDGLFTARIQVDECGTASGTRLERGRWCV